MLDAAAVLQRLAKAAAWTRIDGEIPRVPGIRVLRVPPRANLLDQGGIDLRRRSLDARLVPDEETRRRNVDDAGGYRRCGHQGQRTHEMAAQHLLESFHGCRNRYDSAARSKIAAMMGYARVLTNG